MCKLLLGRIVAAHRHAGDKLRAALVGIAAVGALPLDARAFHVAAQTADQRRHIRNGLIKVQRFQRHGCTANELAVGLYRSRDLKILFGQRGFRGRQRFRPFLFRRILDLVIDCLRRRGALLRTAAAGGDQQQRHHQQSQEYLFHPLHGKLSPSSVVFPVSTVPFYFFDETENSFVSQKKLLHQILRCRSFCANG